MEVTQDRPVAAAIDIGSNSIKMTVGRPDGSGGIEQLDWASDVVRLGQGMDETGRLDEGRVEAAIETLGRFAERARELGATRIVAVATEATRSAANGSEFLERVKSETGIDVRTVDGLEEAALTFRGLAATIDVSGQVVVADIGGGSTELIVANEGVVDFARSIPLGSGRLTDKFIRADPPLRDELAASEAEAAASIQSAARLAPLPQGGSIRLLVVGGTGEFMARLVPDENAIDLKTIRTVLGKLTVLTAAELADAIEAPEARARVLPAGVSIVAAITNHVQPTRVEIARSGIRAGLLIETFQSLGDSPADGAERGGSFDTPDGKSKNGAARGKEERVEAPIEPGFRDTMKALIAERWAAVWKAVPAAIDGTDIEGVHDVRVASRRLRAAMDIAAPVFPQGWFKPLHRAAKEITGALGEVRDRDVLLEALRADRAAAPLAEHPGIDRLIDRVEQERVAARADMEHFLRELVEGPLAREIERRFGPAAAPPRASATSRDLA